MRRVVFASSENVDQWERLAQDQHAVEEEMKKRTFGPLWDAASAYLEPLFSSFALLVASGERVLESVNPNRNLFGFTGIVASLVMARITLEQATTVPSRIHSLCLFLKDWAESFDVAMCSLRISYSRISRGSRWKKVVQDLVRQLEQWFWGFINIKERVEDLKQQEYKVGYAVICGGCRQFFNPRASADPNVYTPCCGF